LSRSRKCTPYNLGAPIAHPLACHCPVINEAEVKENNARQQLMATEKCRYASLTP